MNWKIKIIPSPRLQQQGFLLLKILRARQREERLAELSLRTSHADNGAVSPPPETQIDHLSCYSASETS